ncbi:glycoside hydrolase, partial [Achlya hypogyna]
MGAVHSRVALPQPIVDAPKGTAASEVSLEEHLEPVAEASSTVRPPCANTALVDLNTADSNELASLPGIGPVLSQRIVTHRPYASAEELLSVPGVGQRKFALLHRYLAPIAPESIATEYGPYHRSSLSSADGAPTFVVATWNIRNISRKKATAALEKLIEIMEAYDLIALQEIRDVLVLKRLKHLMRGWDFIASSGVGPASSHHKEHFAYFYRKAKWTRPIPVAVDETLAAGITRRPFVVRAQTHCGQCTVVLINVHVVFGRQAGPRRKEIDAIHAVTAAVDEDAPVVLLGDFNLAPFDVGLAAHGWEPLVRAPSATTVFGNLFDNIWLRRGASSSPFCRVDSGVDRIDHRYFPESASGVKATALAARRQCSAELSDHCPVYMALYLTPALATPANEHKLGHRLARFRCRCAWLQFESTAMKVIGLAVLAAVGVAEDWDAQAEAIVAKMTPAQWIGQMAQVNIGFILDGNNKLSTDAVTQCAKAGVGSFLNGVMSAPQWRSMITQIQQIYAANGAPPVLFGLDSVHGANYVNGAVLSPQQINKGASFNPTLVQQSAYITARDSAAGGLNWVFSPGVDVTTHKRWSRVYESFGEDPYLSSVLGQAAVTGIQSMPGVAATLKHFIGYGATSSGDDRGPAYLSDYEVLNYHAPPFIAAVAAGALSIMSSYVSNNGVPMVANTPLTVNLLRNDMGFNGVLVTDWEDIYNLNNVHHIVSNNQDAVGLSMAKSSVDMSMIPYDLSFIGFAQNLLNSGKTPASRFRESAKRIIKLKLKLGLFSTPVPGASAVSLVGSETDRQAALEMARESIVLLKNKNSALPLKSQPRIFLTGPSMDDVGLLCGGWTQQWQGVMGNDKFPGYQSIKGALLNMYSDKSKITSMRGIDINGVATDPLATAKAMAQAAEYTIVVVGEAPYAEMVGNIPDAT